MTARDRSGWYPGRCKDCAKTAAKGRARCRACRGAHNACEQARRRARKREGQCSCCGAPAAVVAGEPLTTCPAHREYYRARAEAAAK